MELELFHLNVLFICHVKSLPNLHLQSNILQNKFKINISTEYERHSLPQ